MEMHDDTDYEALLADLGMPAELNDSLGLESYQATCPWCGEPMEWVLDPSNTEAYVEDCYVCCRPCLIHPEFAPDGQISGLRIERE